MPVSNIFPLFFALSALQTIAGSLLEQYDLTRTLRMAGYGALIVGPSLHFWFNFLSTCFPKRDVITTFKKIALGQTVYGPAINSVFFSMNAVAQGKAESCFRNSVLLLLNLLIGCTLTVVNKVKYLWRNLDLG